MMRTALLEDPEAPLETQTQAETMFVQGLALVLHKQSFPEALECFQKARELFPEATEQGECLIEEARIHSLLGQNGEAVEALQAALSRFADDQKTLRAEANSQLARLFAGMGQFAECLAAHQASKWLYKVRPSLSMGDFYGFETWLSEQLEDWHSWSLAVRQLVVINPDKLALHRIPPTTDATLERSRKISAGLDECIAKHGEDAGTVGWWRALKAMLCYITRRPEEALVHLEPLLEQEDLPDRVFIHHLAGKSYFKLQRSEDALKCFNKALAFGGEYFDLILDVAFVTEELGDYEAAIKHYEAVQGLDPSQVLPLARAALLHETLNQKAEAVSAYQRLSEADPKNRTALVHLALLNAELRRDEEALAGLNKALKLTGPDPTLLTTRAQIHYRRKQWKNAQKDASRAVELLEPLTLKTKQGALVDAPNKQDAPSPAGDPQGLKSKDLDQPVVATSRLAQARLILAQTLYALSRIDEAADLVDKVLEELPNNDAALLLKGDCSRALGSPEEAVESYKNLIDSLVCESLLRDGLAHYAGGRYNEALVKYRAAYERYPKNWAVFYNSALAYAQLGNHESAIHYLLVARKYNKNVPVMVEAEEQFEALREHEQYKLFASDAS